MLFSILSPPQAVRTEHGSWSCCLGKSSGLTGVYDKITSSHCLFPLASNRSVTKSSKDRKAVFYPPFHLSCLLPASLCLSPGGGWRDWERLQGRVDDGAWCHPRARSRSLCATRPPVSLSPMTTFIMYSEGIIPSSLPPSRTFIIIHLIMREGWMEGLRDRADAR